MASKKEAAVLRGAKLVKKALEAAKATVFTAPEPVPSSLVRKLRLPNGEPLSPGLKEVLLLDGSWLDMAYDDEEGEVESMSLEEVVEETFGEEAVPAFAEAYEMFSEECVFFGAETTRPACLYVGTADDAGEYPVLVMTWEDGVARIGGFVPFDVWVSQELGGLERAKDIGDVPPLYAGLPQTLADSNGDGRLVFTPKAGEAEAGEEENDDEEDENDSESERNDEGGAPHH
jgi:hypothetical protein